MAKFIDETLRIVHNDLTRAPGLALSSIMHNEIYFLKAFLEHYRRLGIKRFFLLDDCSDDGSFEYAQSQEDVCLLRSAHRYGDRLNALDAKRPKRATLAWRNTLLQNFFTDTWHVHLDLDEFLELPPGMKIPDFLAHFERYNLIWAAMIDVYPKSWDDITDETHDISNIAWYFDARPHFRFIPCRPQPNTLYSGARARLRATYLPEAPNKEKYRRQIERMIFKNPYPPMGTMMKPIFLRWDPKMAFRTAHKITHHKSPQMMLPLVHYKFSPNLKKRIDQALRLRSHSAGGEGYHELGQIYERMHAQGADFLADCSKRYDGFQCFENAGIAFNMPKANG